MNSSKIYSLVLSGFVKHPSSVEKIFKMFSLETLTMTSWSYDCLYKEGNNVIILHATSKLRKIFAFIHVYVI